MAERKVVLNRIGADEPGYMRRMQRIGYFRRVLSGMWTDKDIDDAIEFILDFVHQPADREEARELLLDASQNEYMAMFSVIGGDSDSPLSESG